MLDKHLIYDSGVKFDTKNLDFCTHAGYKGHIIQCSYDYSDVQILAFDFIQKLLWDYCVQWKWLFVYGFFKEGAKSLFFYWKAKYMLRYSAQRNIRLSISWLV